MQNKKKFLLGKDESDLVDLAVNQGEPAYRGKQLYNWLYVRRIQSFDDMTDISKSYKKALSNDLYGTPERAYCNTGWAYYKQGDIGKAIKERLPFLKLSISADNDSINHNTRPPFIIY